MTRATAAGGDRPLAGQPWLTAPETRTLLAALGSGDCQVRFVGGCVRDALLGRPVGDLDLATAIRPDAVLQRLADAGLKAIPTGLAHGTVTAVIGARTFEITTLRRDLACDGRHAAVAFTEDFAEDAARRDFTINAMSCDPDGRVYDPFGGRADLAAGRVRFVGVARDRVAEDYLRVLRFFRFLAHYGQLPADPEALAACAAATPELGRLSGERIRLEMLKLLAAPDPVPALELMHTAGVLVAVAPGVVAPARLADLLGVAPDADPLLRLAILVRDGSKAAVQIARRWRLSGRDSERLQILVTTDLPPLATTPAERRQWLYRLGAAPFRDLLRLAAAAAPAGARDALAAGLAAADGWQQPDLPIGGDDLLALGLTPGPDLGELLRGVEHWWQAQDFIPDRRACLTKARDLLADQSAGQPDNHHGPA